MSRIAKAPIAIPSGVDIKIEGGKVAVKGGKGSLSFDFSLLVSVEIADGVLSVKWNRDDKIATALAGTTRAVISNMVTGVSTGFERKLNLVGVGYRAQAKDDVLSLSLGFSHPVDFQVPLGVSVETPSQTEIIIRGTDKQKVGQVAAKVRAYRPPEPYKGKGVKYAEENIARKEAKKK